MVIFALSLAGVNVSRKSYWYNYLTYEKERGIFCLSYPDANYKYKQMYLVYWHVIRTSGRAITGPNHHLGILA